MTKSDSLGKGGNDEDVHFKVANHPKMKGIIKVLIHCLMIGEVKALAAGHEDLLKISLQSNV